MSVESKQCKNQFKATDLPITLYLNQRLTFDMLATLRGGFSSFSTIHTTSSKGTTNKAAGEAQFGLSNAFALLGLNFGGQISRGAEKTKSESTSQNVVHTPASLFAQLRSELWERKLVHDVSQSSDLDEIDPGDFVEFQATLRRNPLIDLLNSFEGLIPLIKMATSGTMQSNSQKGQRKPPKGTKAQPKQGEFSAVGKQIEVFREAITADGSQDLIAEIGSMRVVLTTTEDYFIDPTMNDSVDGTFRVFGKVTRVTTDKDEEINLFRRSALGKFASITEAFEPLRESMQDSGFNTPIETKITGPTMQVIPIAIFS